MDWCGARVHWELRTLLQHMEFSRSDGAVFKRISNCWRTWTKLSVGTGVLPQLRLPSRCRKFEYGYEVFNPWAEDTVGTEALLHILGFVTRSPKDSSMRESAATFLSSLFRFGLAGDFELELSAPWDEGDEGEAAEILVIVDDGKVSLNHFIDQADAIVALRPLRRRRAYMLRGCVGGTILVEELLGWFASEALQWLRNEFIAALAMVIEQTVIARAFTSDPIVSGFSVPKRKRSDSLLDDAVAFGKVGDAKIKGTDLAKVARARNGSSITAFPVDQVMRVTSSRPGSSSRRSAL